MIYPNFKEEKKLWKKGCRRIVGLDEAGRGCLAAPVVAAAVIIKSIQGKFVKICGVKDSKKLTPKKKRRNF